MRRITLLLIFNFLILVHLLYIVFPSYTLAASLTNKSDTLESLKVNVISSHTITFTLNSSNSLNANETVTLDFDEDGGGWNVNGSSDTVSDYTFFDGSVRSIVGVDGDCSGHLGGNDIAVLANDTTGLITFTTCTNYTSSTSGATVIIDLGEAGGGINFITNPSSQGTFPLTLNGTQGDTGTILVPFISDDQVVIQSIVDESVTFSIDDTSIGFGVLTELTSRYATSDSTGSSTETPAHTIAVGTNATGGYSLTIQGTTLESGGFTIEAIGGTPESSSVGTEQFGIRLTATGGSGTVNSPYDSSDYAFDIDNFPDSIAFASGSTSNTIYSVYYLANISTSTEAGLYTTSLTYVATGSF